ncbi:thioredoxin domain-containing protein [Corynebacterium sp. UMB10321]|nr:thioredoxin domain-containing protein [Corynebacterium sp. UMB10321]MDK8243051.1 thioredoxin domain-containing protein [Corynebacterium sp. UMB10321]
MSDTKIPPLMWAFTAVLAVGTGVGGYVIGANSATPATETAQTAPSQAAEEPAAEPTMNEAAAEIERRDANDPMALGDVDAPVVLSEFSDWDCPFCIKANVDIMPQIIKNYVDEGKVRIEFNDFVVNGQAAVEAARAGRAAADQGKFFEYQDAYMAEAIKAKGHPDFDMEDFVRFAEAAGMPDMEKFKADAASDKYDAALQDANNLAQRAGFNSTPSFLVNGQEIIGAQPYEAFEQAIEDALAK